MDADPGVRLLVGNVQRAMNSLTVPWGAFGQPTVLPELNESAYNVLTQAHAQLTQAVQRARKALDDG